MKIIAYVLPLPAHHCPAVQVEGYLEERSQSTAGQWAQKWADSFEKKVEVALSFLPPPYSEAAGVLCKVVSFAAKAHVHDATFCK